MDMFAIDIDGRAIVVFPAGDPADARRTAEGDGLTEDLQGFGHAGRPLWNGVDTLSVRTADAAETEAWAVGFAVARWAGEVDEETARMGACSWWT